ncbi:hypothetical protein J6590_022273 [Homalodisca vitripennis]|nr:hypothetical protein J6590_022273 [Homalodisca vitripennis]
MHQTFISDPSSKRYEYTRTRLTFTDSQRTRKCVCEMARRQLNVAQYQQFSAVEEQSCEVIADSSVGKRMKKEVFVALESYSNDIAGGIALVNKSEGGLALLSNSSKSEGEIALVNKSEGELALLNNGSKSEGGSALLNDSKESEGGIALVNKCVGGLALVNAVCSEISKEAELTLGKLTASVVKREHNEVWSQLQEETDNTGEEVWDNIVMGTSSSEKMDVLTLIDKKLAHLSEEDKNILKPVLLEYKSLFYDGKGPLGCTSLIEHKIPTGDAAPIKMAPYRLPEAPEIAVRCFKNPLGALAKSVVGRAMSSCCGRDRHLPSASDICRAGDPSQVLDVRLTHAQERTASFLTGMG